MSSLRTRFRKHLDGVSMLPRRYRKRYLAQMSSDGNCYCPYCGHRIAKHMFPRSTGGQHPQSMSIDHVRPPGQGGARGIGSPNTLLAHKECNHRKGHRPPFPCEELLAVVTWEILRGIHDSGIAIKGRRRRKRRKVRTASQPAAAPAE